MVCEGLTGKALEDCRGAVKTTSGFPMERVFGLLALLFGVILIWQPQLIVWLLGALLIIGGLMFLFFKRNFILSVIMLIAGGGIIFYPTFIVWMIALIFLVLGVIIILQQSKNKMYMGIGVGIVIIAGLIVLLPNLMGIILGIALIFGGLIFLIGGDIGELPLAGKYWRQLK